LESARTVKIQGLDTFWKCKSQGGGYRVSHGRPLKMSSRTLSIGGLHMLSCRLSRQL